MRTHDRRRILFATAFTIIALPALWVANADRGTNPTVGAAGVPAPVAAGEPDSTYESEGPVFLEAAPVVEPLQPTPVQTPAADTGTTTRATFKRIADPGGCATNLALPGTTLTVENLDNGRSITCRAVLGVAVPDGAGVVLDTALMAQITDLTESPIPVRVSW